MHENGIENILALRGDRTDDTAPNGDFEHASDLIKFIKENYDFNIIAACYPEVHPESTGAVDDLKWLRYKVDCGADHLISQLFLDNRYFPKICLLNLSLKRLKSCVLFVLTVYCFHEFLFRRLDHGKGRRRNTC